MKQLIVFLFATLAVLSCGHAPPGRGAGEIEASTATQTSFRVETVVGNLQVPWAITWTPDGRMLFTERAGRVRVVENGSIRDQPLFTVPDVEPTGESGLMDISVHPKFDLNHWLYLTYAYKGNGQQVRVVRYRDSGDSLVEPKVIIEGLPAAQFHAGCRARFGPDGKLYITAGDATEKELAQRLDSLAGKTLRLNDDGSVPADNPFVGRKDARAE